MRTIQRLALVASFVTALAALAGGCTASIPDGRYACVTMAECPEGFSCAGGFCYRSAVDAGEADLHFDAGPDFDGGPRDDGGPCTCPPDADPCTDDFCLEGTCTHPPSAAGASCGDNATCIGGDCTCTAPWDRCGTKGGDCSVNTLTSTEHCGMCDNSCAAMGTTCNGGMCTACTTLADCDDGVGCTIDECGAGGVCTHMSMCTGGAVCCGTSCVPAGCADTVACTDDSCNGTICVHPITAGMCLIPGFGCVPTGALGPVPGCQVCMPTTTNNAWTYRPDSTPCDDGNFCNGADTCLGGDCQHPGRGCVFDCAGAACCGEGGEPCCPGGVCSGSGRACYGGTSGICMGCGTLGGQCCGAGARPAGTCNSTYTCVDDGSGNGRCDNL